jgi:hypothetical protein
MKPPALLGDAVVVSFSFSVSFSVSFSFSVSSAAPEA